MSVVEQPREPRLQVFTVEDEALGSVRRKLSWEAFALEDVTPDEWAAFEAAISSR